MSASPLHERQEAGPPTPRRPLRLGAGREPFLRWVTARADDPRETKWGPYRCFDGYALAAFAAGDAAAGVKLLAETLAMMETNLADERSGRGNQWHLADFALHPILRLWLDRRGSAEGEEAAQWRRFETLARGFLWHYGDLTENHDLLHAAGRLLVAEHLDDPGPIDAAAARAEVLAWMDRWFTRGSTEWGAELYTNVNLLGLLNLHDLSGDASVRHAAHAVLDAFALGEALHRFAGTTMGAARRTYGCHRLDAARSPTRSLHAVWFGAADPPLGAATEPFSEGFIGGAIVAAVSGYRPPAMIREIAGEPAAVVSSTTHRVGGWAEAEASPASDPAAGSLGSHAWRHPQAMLGVMNSPGGSGRYTEQAWQITLGERALMFSNQPSFVEADRPVKDPGPILAAYERAEEPAPGTAAWSEAPGNAPPGHADDFRPGFWQGNGVGPRSFGAGRLAMLIYRVPPAVPLPWVHLYLPRDAFDDLREIDGWKAVRRGSGYGAVWSAAPWKETLRGTWARRELRAPPGDAALIACVGCEDLHGGFDRFVDSLAGIRPRFEPAALRLHATCPDEGVEWRLDHAAGPARGGVPHDSRGPRIACPWGVLEPGAREMTLERHGERLRIGLDPPDTRASR